jgi:hypothetical protein
MKSHCQLLFSTLIAFYCLLSSCSIKKEISYRTQKDDEFTKACGYSFSCKKDDNSLCISIEKKEKTDSLNLNIANCENALIEVKYVNIHFPSTNDSLPLLEVRGDQYFHFSNDKLVQILERNVEIDINIVFAKNGKDTMNHFQLKRFNSSHVKFDELPRSG